MKRILYIIIGAAAVVSVNSCKDFFDRTPTNTIPAPSYFSNESEIKMYTDGFIQSQLPDFTDIPCSNSDFYSDLVASSKVTKLYQGTYTVADASGWAASNWSFLRSVNYMLDNMEKAKDNVPEDIYNHYEGVARFWRARFYFTKVTTFGNVPWIEHVLQPSDSLILYGPRDKREVVMNHVLQDLKFAANNCMRDKFVTDGRIYINQDVVLTFMSRVCLYEGTYRKHHNVNYSDGEPWISNDPKTGEPLAGSEDFLKEAVWACEKLINGGNYRLHSGDVKTAYSDVFLKDELQKEEVIWGRSTNESINVRHDVTHYFNSPSYSVQPSPTKDLINHYLKLDGKPITNEGKIAYKDEFTDRDWRLSQTVSPPGHQYKNGAGETVAKPVPFDQTHTGYQFCKWNQEDYANYSNSFCTNSIPVYRYAEVLLNYAEAKAELNGGVIDQLTWNTTIGALRERAGVKSIYPGSSDYVVDTYLREYYNADEFGLTNYEIELRRERATEFACECGFRMWDLKRWHDADLIVRRYRNIGGWRGLYISEDDVKNGFDINGFTRKVLVGSGSTTSEQYAIANNGNNESLSLTEKTHGFLVYNHRMVWEEKFYLTPIPQTAMNVNPKLGQNVLWE